jgi:type IV secretion system protein VirB3
MPGESTEGLMLDPLFVGATRPPMRWGVTYSALLFNMVFTLEAFLLTKNLLALPLCLPIHGVCMLLCARDPRFFYLVLLWAHTRMPALFANYGGNVTRAAQSLGISRTTLWRKKARYGL